MLLTSCMPVSGGFLSTLSLRRATVQPVPQGVQITNFYPRSPCGERRSSRVPAVCHWYFYPRSPCGERRPRLVRHRVRITISIHALLAESDVIIGFLFLVLIQFLSTLSLRRATLASILCTSNNKYISIHALLAESDRLPLSC